MPALLVNYFDSVGNIALTYISQVVLAFNCIGKLMVYYEIIVRLPRLSSGRKCDCRARCLGFDSWVRQISTGFFGFFENFLVVVLSIWQ